MIHDSASTPELVAAVVKFGSDVLPNILLLTHRQ